MADLCQIANTFSTIGTKKFIHLIYLTQTSFEVSHDNIYLIGATLDQIQQTTVLTIQYPLRLSPRDALADEWMNNQVEEVHFLYHNRNILDSYSGHQIYHRIHIFYTCSCEKNK